MDLEGVLKKYFGFNAFRNHQRDIIESICNHDDVLAILPTGAGKSLCYQLPAMILPGITLVVSPLISLMQDQVVALCKAGIPAAFLNSSLPQREVFELLSNLSNKKILYIAPERFSSDLFQDYLKTTNVSFIAIDEAHCISEWGHSFRPEYRQLSFLKSMFPQSAVLALTATATPDVERDIVKQLAMQSPKIVKSSFDRTNLTIRINEKRDTTKQLREFLNKHQNESGIIYCATRKTVESTYAELNQAGFQVTYYHAGLTDAARAKNQHDFIYDDVPLIVATVAFGMGIHKPDIRFIVHMDMPKTIEQYYQEIGRAGRDGLPAECLMFYGYQEIRTYRFFIDQLDNEVEKKHLEQKLYRMQNLCQSTECRRCDLLNYFGETYPQPVCNHCDNCLDDVELIDGTVIAQKILSCIYRLNQSFGMQMVIDVLKGSKNQKVLSRGFEKLSTHNLMNTYPEEEIRYYINSLVTMRHLMRTDGEYPVLKWTDTSRSVIDKEIDVKFKKKHFRERKQKASLSIDHDHSLFEKLRKLRLELSRKEGIPPFAVFPDRTLMEMSKSLPTSKTAMLEINGVGPHKWRKYGTKFINAIQEYTPKSFDKFSQPDLKSR